MFFDAQSLAQVFLYRLCSFSIDGIFHINIGSGSTPVGLHFAVFFHSVHLILLL